MKIFLAAAWFAIASLCLTCRADAEIQIELGGNTGPALVEAIKQLAVARSEGETERARIILPAGDYQLNQPIRLSPSIVGSGLTLIAQKDAEVQISGGQRLTHRGKDDQGRWRFSLPDGVAEDALLSNVMVIDGTMRDAARYPAGDPLRIEKSLEDRRSGFVARPGDLPDSIASDFRSLDCQLVLLHDWSSSRMPIGSIDAATRTIRTLGPIGCAADHYAIDHFEKQPRYFLVGHPSFVREAGQWALDRKQREIVVGAGPEASPPQVVLPIAKQLLVAAGDDDEPLKNLVVQGITFCNTSFELPSGGLAGAQATMHEPRDPEGNRTSKHRVMLDAAVRLDHAVGCRFANCDFRAIGMTGLWIGHRTSKCKVFRCRIRNVGGNGINLGEDTVRRIDGEVWYASKPQQVATGNLVDQCVVSRCGEILPGAVAIWAGINKQLQLTQNHIHDCPYTGISIGWVWNKSPTPAAENRIEDNRIEFVMQTLSDGGGIYTLGRQEGSVIENNRISDVPLNAGRAESNGMFLDQGSTGFTIHNNTIRRIDRSPIRFHQAGSNLVDSNRWELATADTPPVRFNNTPPENITIKQNETVPAQKSFYLIGNSLTADTVPAKLDGHVHWHIDCGKNLAYIYDNPSDPCVGTSRLWPTALTTMQYDVISMQPYYGTTIDTDVATIGKWIALQPKAEFVIHTGWAKHEQFQKEAGDRDPAGTLTHSLAYYDELLKRLRAAHPDRVFRRTEAMERLMQLSRDIESGKAPVGSIDELYRDGIHMTLSGGRYLMHNTMRQTLGQPIIESGFPEIDPELKLYLDGLLSGEPTSDKP